MCGIIGLFSTSPHGDHWPDHCLDAMVTALQHRGPDGSGKHVETGLFIGHTRLAVLDLSNAGRQPMISENGRFIISFNGEIYNFRSLRNELILQGNTFKSNSDTEVLLAAWTTWGETTLDRIDGIFAFAIFDRHERSLHLVRDHLGIKPLFYWQNGHQTAFASEPLAMFGPIIPFPDPNPVDLDTYFTFNYLPAPHSGLNNVQQLPPGHHLKITPLGNHLAPYWQLQCPSQPKPWNPDLIETFRDKLHQSVKNQLVADAPVGLFLSGGLDSTAVALAIQSSGKTLESYTLGFEQTSFNEAPAATNFADHVGLPNTVLMFSWTEETIINTLKIMRELLADASCFPYAQLAQFAKQRSTVILSGDGGDELLAGYSTYRASQWTTLLRHIPAPLRKQAMALTRFLPADSQRYSLRMVAERLLMATDAGPLRDHASFRRIVSNPMKKRLYKQDFFQAVTNTDPIGDYVEKIKTAPKERSKLTALQLGDVHHFLPSVLAKVDRMSMASGLEVRVPMLSRDLVEFCFQLPDEAKQFQGKGKRILREAIASQVPPNHLQHPKAGFLPPVDRWFRHPGPMINVFKNHLEWAIDHKAGWLHWAEVEKCWNEHRKGKINIGFTLLGILQFINWLKQIKEIPYKIL